MQITIHNFVRKCCIGQKYEPPPHTVTDRRCKTSNAANEPEEYTTHTHKQCARNITWANIIWNGTQTNVQIVDYSAAATAATSTATAAAAAKVRMRMKSTPSSRRRISL